MEVWVGAIARQIAAQSKGKKFPKDRLEYYIDISSDHLSRNENFDKKEFVDYVISVKTVLDKS